MSKDKITEAKGVKDWTYYEDPDYFMTDTHDDVKMATFTAKLVDRLKSGGSVDLQVENRNSDEHGMRVNFEINDGLPALFLFDGKRDEYLAKITFDPEGGMTLSTNGEDSKISITTDSRFGETQVKVYHPE